MTLYNTHRRRFQTLALLLLLAVCGLQCAHAIFDFELLSTNFPPSVRPTSTNTLTITLLNNGSVNWDASVTVLSLRLANTQATFSFSWSVALGTATSTGAIATFAGPVGPLNIAGIFQLVGSLSANQLVAPTKFNFTFESTCSDGNFCNGVERFTNGACVSSAASCDDQQSCTLDSCDIERGICTYTPQGNNCGQCTSPPCTPSCSGRTCGSDGCYGTCGTCASGLVCEATAGQCIVAQNVGTCADPIPIFTATRPFSYGIFTMNNTNTDGFNQIIPACNTLSDALEKVFLLQLPSTLSRHVGIDIRTYATYDTVIDVRTQCLFANTSVICNDDSTPPGNLLSRVTGFLEPGQTYYVDVDGYSLADKGNFTLWMKFVDNCVPICDGAFCGTDYCGGSCGDCGTGQVCNSIARCIPSPCTPNCAGKACGDDGCGGSCGTCTNGALCLYEDGICQQFPYCDHLLPTCSNCTASQYCGSDCKCHTASEALPDFYVLQNQLLAELQFETRYFPNTSCAVYEGCVNAVGNRRIMRFTAVNVNQGFGAFMPPQPKTRPDLFTYSTCHNHYHFDGFAIYRLYTLDRTFVLQGRKQGYCMEDTFRTLTTPAVSCLATYDCGNQGVSAGWSDSYGYSLDCQWLDITDVAPGVYILEVQVNPQRIVHEYSFENNVASVQVTITSAASSALASPMAVFLLLILFTFSITLLSVFA